MTTSTITISDLERADLREAVRRLRSRDANGADLKWARKALGMTHNDVALAVSPLTLAEYVQVCERNALMRIPSRMRTDLLGLVVDALLNWGAGE